MFEFTFDEESVLRELGANDFDEQTKARIIDSIHTNLNARMRARMLPELDKSEVEAFNHITDPAEAKVWLEKRFPTYEAMYQEEFNDLIDDMKNHAEAVEAAVEQLHDHEK